MSFNIKQKLFPLLRDPANLPAPFKTSFIRKTPLARPTFGQTSSRSFSWSKPKPQRAPTQKTSVYKSFASGSLLFVDIGSSSAAASPAISTCTATAEKSLYTSNILSRRSISSLVQQTWRREIHSSARRRERGSAKRNQSSKANGANGRKGVQNGASKPPPPPIPPKRIEPPPTEPVPHNYLHLPHMPKMPHRPTKEELLAAATGFWSRLKVRFKWFSIRSVRPWNVDDWSAFVSWFVLGNIVWVFIGTTTFFSLVILSINTVVAQGTLS